MTDAKVLMRVQSGGMSADMEYYRFDIERLERDVAPSVASKPARPTPSEPVSGASDKGAERAAPAKPSDRDVLLTALSGACIGRYSPSVGERVAKLQSLMRSDEPGVQDVTRLALGINGLYALVRKDVDLSPECRDLMLEMFVFAAQSRDGPVDSLDEAIGLMRGDHWPKRWDGRRDGPLLRGIEKVQRVMETGDQIQRAQNKMRALVKEMVIGDAPESLAAGAVSVKFSPMGKSGAQLTPNDDGYLMVTNRGREELPRFVCVVDVAMDDQKLDAAIEAVRRQWAIPNAIIRVFEEQPEDNENSLEALHRRQMLNALRGYERLRLGYGVVVSVPVLKPGETVKFAFAGLGDLMNCVESVDVLAVSQGKGRWSTRVEVEGMRKEIDRIVKAQAKRGGR